MIELNKIAMNPWDFTLYKANDGSIVMKVIFSEGDYKIDIGRFFMIDSLGNGTDDIELLKTMAAQIRENYPDVAFPLLDKADLKILK
ncbi:hypothetical protein [Mycolicibacterium baixiangningiae]|uniref:hypothetical protein n=1 Tax=Mycolicibacterium baixiangningiae TaxID=2761578 RepID=UPI0018D0CDC6|nr:hypothetical protein [Mycolicibacterium baixiangningiae]